MRSALFSSSSPIHEQEGNETNVAFCVMCSTVRSTEKGKCIHCHNKINSPQIESPMTPQIEGNKPSKSPSSPCHTQYSEGIAIITKKQRPEPPSPLAIEPNHNDNNNQSFPINDISFSSDEYDDDADYRQLMCLEGDDIKSNSYQTSSSSPYPPSPISPTKKSSKHRNKDKRYKRKRNKKRKSNHNHYNNHNHHRIKKMKKEIIDITTSNNNNSIGSNKKNPVVIIDDDNDSDDDVQILPDFPSPTPSKSSRSSYNFDDTISMMSTQSSSPSLSICSGVGRMTIDLTDDSSSSVQNHRYNRPTRKNPPNCHSEIMAAWRRQINPKETTLRGLELVNSLKMPRPEYKALIELIRDGFKHIIGASIRYQHRLIAVVVGLLEIMKLEQYTGNPCNNWLNSTRKAQALIVAPTRHQALEAKKMFVQIGMFYELYAEALIGGMPSYQCANRLRGGIDVICGTPGKLMDMVQRGALTKDKLNDLVAFVMDGADEIIKSRSMKKQMRIITEAFPDRRVRVLWLESVTTIGHKQNARRHINRMDPSINNRNVDERNMINCIAPSIANDYDDIRRMIHVQRMIDNGEEWKKREALEEIIKRYECDSMSMVVFFNTRSALRRNWNILVKSRNLVMLKDKIYAIDGSCNNMERRDIISNFKEYGGILCGTDFISTGISFDRVETVVNFDVPSCFNVVVQYIKRAGIAIDNKKDVYIFSMVNDHEMDRERIKKISNELKVKMVDLYYGANRRYRQ